MVDFGFCENMVQGVLDCVSSVPEVRHTPMIGDAARPKCQKRTLYEQRKVCAALQVSERRGANSNVVLSGTWTVATELLFLMSFMSTGCFHC